MHGHFVFLYLDMYACNWPGGGDLSLIQLIGVESIISIDGLYSQGLWSVLKNAEIISKRYKSNCFRNLLISYLRSFFIRTQY